jgi:hypothetical protein
LGGRKRMGFAKQQGIVLNKKKDIAKERKILFLSKKQRRMISSRYQRNHTLKSIFNGTE